MTECKGMRAGWLALSALVLAVGCGGDPTPAGGSETPPPPAERIPDCGGVAAVLGPMVAGLLPTADHEERFDNERMYGVSCSWVTPEAASDNPFEAIKLGALVVSIDVDRMREPGEEGILRSMGMIHDDPRADAVDAFVTAPGAPLDLGAPVSIAGIQVTRGLLSVSINGGGVLMTQADGLRHVTNDAAIEASVALLRSID